MPTEPEAPPVPEPTGETIAPDAAAALKAALIEGENPTPPPAEVAEVEIDPNDPDAGAKKAVHAELAAARAARKEAEKAAKALKLGLLTEQERAVESAKDAGRSEVMSELVKLRFENAILTAGAGKLKDPADAVKLLDLNKFASEDGDVDADAVSSAIEELLTAKPYLAAGVTPTTTGGGGAMQGQPGDLPLNGDPLLNILKAKVGAR